MPMMVADNAAGATRAYRANDTGKTLAKPMLFRRWKASSHQNDTLPPLVVANAVPTNSERKPVTATKLPMVILLTSDGSRYFLDHLRQKITAPARQLTERIESTVISQVVGICLP